MAVSDIPTPEHSDSASSKPFRQLLLFGALLCCAIGLLDGPGVTNALPGSTLFCGGFLAIMVGMGLWRLQVPKRRSHSLAFGGSLLVWLICASFSSYSKFGSQASLAGWVGGLAILAAIVLGVRRRAEWRLAAHALVLQATILSLYGVYQWFTELATDHARAVIRATFSNSDCFSVIPLIGLFLSSGLLPGAPRATKLLLCIESIILCTALLGSGSRAGLLGGSVAVVVFLGIILSRRHWKSMSEALVALSPALAVVPLMLFSGLLLPSMGRLQGLMNGEDEQGILMREDVAVYGVITAFQHPLLGTGPGTFDLAYQQFRPSDAVPPYMYVNRAHDDFVEIAVEGGLPALVLWCLLLWFSVSRAARFSSKGALPSEAASAAAAVAGVAAYSCLNFAVPVPADLFFWFAVIGLALSIPVSKEAAEERKVPVRALGALFVMAGLCACVFGERAARANALLDKVGDLQRNLRWEEALLTLQKAIPLEKTRAELISKKATLEQTLGLVQGDKTLQRLAGVDFEAALALNPRDQGLIRAASGYLRQVGNYAQAENILSRGVEYAPYQDQILKELAAVQLIRNEPGAALDSMKNLAQRDSANHADLVKLLAGVERLEPGKGAEAIERWARLKVLDRSFALEAGREAAEALLAAKFPQPADSLLTSLERIEPRDSGFLVDKAQAAQMLGKEDASLAMLETLLARKEEEATQDYSRALVTWAAVKMKGKDGKRVSRRMAEYLVRNPQMSNVRLKLVEVYLHNQQDEQARTLLEESLQSDPDNSLLLSHRANLYRKEGSADLATQYFRRALQADPQNGEAVAGLKALGKD